MSAATTVTVWEKSKAWATLARPPFHSVGVLPFAVGCVLAWRAEGTFDWALWGWGTLAVVLIMLSTYWAGEYFDYEEDRISGELGRSRFAGGTGVVHSGIVSRRAPLFGSIVALICAGAVGLILWLGYGTGPWTIPLGILGMIGGFLYSTPPVRWVSTGVGELWIGICYGFLPVAVGYYLPTGRLDPLVLYVSLPIAATIFNVILANEFPDFTADGSAGKLNLLQRLGRESGAQLYATISAIGWLTVLFSIWAGVSSMLLAYYSLPFLASVYVTLRFLQGKWSDSRELELMCGLGIFVNLGTSLAYILVFVCH
ncbi:prenyltransferase [Thermodesulfobacteriota bacterium]